MIIYKITNNVNGKIYIGQTTGKLSDRWSAHCNTNSLCTYLKKAINKYGKENFAIEEIDGANSLSELNYLEQHYIHIYNSLAPNGYNLRSGGGNSRHNEESKAKMRKPKSEEFRKKLSERMKGTIPKEAITVSAKKRTGIKLTNEHKAKCSAALKGRKFTEEHKKRISNALKGKKLSVETKEKIRENALKQYRKNGVFAKMEEIKDKSIIKCKHCGKECTRIFHSRYPSGKDKKWVDDMGREFNGHVCPSCNSEKKSLKQKLKRRSDRAAIEMALDSNEQQS